MMDSHEFMKKCKGVFPVQYCPYTESGELDLDGLKENTEFLVDFARKGSKDVVIMTNGSTTECYANSIEEQKTVIKTVVDVVAGRVPVVVGASQPGTRETIKMVKYVEEAGGDCAMVILPYYHVPTKEGMYRHFNEIAKASKIAIMIYNNPTVSGSLIDPVLMKRLSQIDNIVAVKDNTPDVSDYAWKAASIEPEDMILLNGYGELHYMGSAAYGFRYQGFVSFIANFAPSTSYAVYDAVKEKNFVKAQKALEKQLPLWSLLGEFMGRRETPSIIPPILRTNYMYMSIGKAAMDLVGLKGGPLRLPMEDLASDEIKELKQVLKGMGAIPESGT